MERPLVSWEVKKNEQGVNMAIVNRNTLTELLKYVNYLELKVKNNDVLPIVIDCKICNDTGFKSISETNSIIKITRCDCSK